MTTELEIRTMIDPPRGWTRPEEDRRESPRLPVELAIRGDATDEIFEYAPGDLALGGIGWHGTAREVGDRVQVALPIADRDAPVRVVAEILRVSARGSRLWLQARFVELPVGAELAIARWLHRQLDHRRFA